MLRQHIFLILIEYYFLLRQYLFDKQVGLERDFWNTQVHSLH